MLMSERIQKSKKLNAFVTETLDKALDHAKISDEIILKDGVLQERQLPLKICFVLKMSKLQHLVKF